MSLSYVTMDSFQEMLLWIEKSSLRLSNEAADCKEGKKVVEGRMRIWIAEFFALSDSIALEMISYRIV